MRALQSSMPEKGSMLILSSVSGGGKSTIARLLLEKYPDRLCRAITATTRAPRGKEAHAKDYYFYSEEEFLEKIREQYFLEYAKVHGNFYGVPYSSVIKKLGEGFSVILDIDIQGMRTIKEKFPEEKLLSIFLMPPSRKVWQERLRKRGTDSAVNIQKRIAQGYREMEAASKYDHIICNDTLEGSLGQIAGLIQDMLLPS